MANKCVKNLLKRDMSFYINKFSPFIINLKTSYLSLLVNIRIFIKGGSNDQSFPNGRALIEAFPKCSFGIINIDAHFDVRPLKEGKTHSGSPFRQIMETE
jgi:arginase family enzyme